MATDWFLKLAIALLAVFYSARILLHIYGRHFMRKWWRRLKRKLGESEWLPALVLLAAVAWALYHGFGLGKL